MMMIRHGENIQQQVLGDLIDEILDEKICRFCRKLKRFYTESTDSFQPEFLQPNQCP